MSWSWGADPEPDRRPAPNPVPPAASCVSALGAAAVLATVMAVVAVYLALTLSPWVLLAWPGAALLFVVFVAIEPYVDRRQVVDIPPCAGCTSPLCPDCTGATR